MSCGKLFDQVAFGALVRRKRGKRYTQQSLAERIWNDPARKSDISRIENGKTRPQEQTVQYLCSALDISDAEMEPIRSGGVKAVQLDQIPTLSRDELELLANRFEIEAAHSHADADLRQRLTHKAEEYRSLKAELEHLKQRYPQLDNVVAEAIALLEGETVDTRAVRAMIREARKSWQDSVVRDALEKDAEFVEIEARTHLYEQNPDEAALLRTDILADLEQRAGR